MAPHTPAPPLGAGGTPPFNATVVGKRVPIASASPPASLRQCGREQSMEQKENEDELEREVAVLVSSIARQASKGYTGETWYDFDLPLDRTDPITIIHFNDVYNIESRCDGTGGVSRFVTALQSFQHQHPLILFSGDALNPSVMSTYTRGRHMIPFLNLLKIHTACFGNHDFDFGIDELEYAVGSCNFPWLISNVFEKTGQSAGLASLRTMENFKHEEESEGVFAEDYVEVHGLPLANGMKYRLFEWQGIRVGIIGLVEKEWLETLACIGKDDVYYVDFVEAANCLCRILRQKECELIIALTHMRAPNDERLAKEAEDIDLILGGHDHDYYGLQRIGNIPVVKSGTDFRDFTVITIYPGHRSRVDASPSSPQSRASSPTRAGNSPSKIHPHEDGPQLTASAASNASSSSSSCSSASSSASPCGDVGLGRDRAKREEEACCSGGMSIRIKKVFSEKQLLQGSPSPSLASGAEISRDSASPAPLSPALLAEQNSPAGFFSPTAASGRATAGLGSPHSPLSPPLSSGSLPVTPKLNRFRSSTFVSEEAARREAAVTPDMFRGPLLPTTMEGGEEVMPFFLGGSIVEWSRVRVDREHYEKNKHVELLVKKYEQNLKKQMKQVLVDAGCVLETRFAVIRTSESNVGNWLCDIMRRECRADVAILNSGTIRSDCLFQPGPFRFGDLAAMLPMADTLCVIAVHGSVLLEVLENAVSQVPKTEGRFLQVAGLRFAFDSSKPPGQRVLRDSVKVTKDACGGVRSGANTPVGGGKHDDEYIPLDTNRVYSVATKTYVAQGRDGFDVLSTCPTLVEDELLAPLPTMVRSALSMAELANGLKRPHSRITFKRLTSFTSMQQDDMIKDFGCCVTSNFNYVLAPKVDGRIVDVAKKGGAAETP